MPPLRDEKSSIEYLDRLFQRQSKWTRPFRDFFFRHRFPEHFRILDAGCGTGVLSEDITISYGAQVHSIDIDFDMVRYSHHQHPAVYFHAQADIYHLPFPSKYFHCVMTHFVFLWLKSPEDALKEMIRVTMPSGWIVAIAEPDYEARIDFPQDTADIGKMQTQSLVQRGIIPTMGRQLSALFNKCGLTHITTGVYSGEWNIPQEPTQFEQEWETIEKDLLYYLSMDEVQSYRQRDFRHFISGRRISFVPTFYAFGQVPD